MLVGQGKENLVEFDLGAEIVLLFFRSMAEFLVAKEMNLAIN